MGKNGTRIELETQRKNTARRNVIQPFELGSLICQRYVILILKFIIFTPSQTAFKYLKFAKTAILRTFSICQKTFRQPTIKTMDEEVVGIGEVFG